MFVITFASCMGAAIIAVSVLAVAPVQAHFGGNNCTAQRIN